MDLGVTHLAVNMMGYVLDGPEAHVDELVWFRDVTEDRLSYDSQLGSSPE